MDSKFDVYCSCVLSVNIFVFLTYEKNPHEFLLLLYELKENVR